MTKFETVLKRIDEVPVNNSFEEKAKEKVIQVYKKQIALVDKVEWATIKSFSFKNQIKFEAKILKQIDQLTKVTVKLERHLYAPELNCLHFKNGTTYKTPAKREFSEAIKFACLDMNEENFKKAIS